MTERRPDPVDLSVVVPCRNAGEVIGELLESLADQRWDRSWETVVADNGSTDDSRAVCESFIGRVPGLRILDASGRAGASHARNRGVEAARGSLLVFCDADDVPAEGWVHAIAAALDRCELVASRFDHHRLNAEGFRRGYPQEDGLQTLWYPPRLAHAAGTGFGIRAELFRRLGGFDEDLLALEDTDLWIRAQIAGVEPAFCAEALVYLRHRDEPGAAFRQARTWARYNELIYRRYRHVGGGDLDRPWRRYFAVWRRLLRRVGRIRDPRRRYDWLWRAGWQIGLFEGCLRYRVPPV